MMYKKLIFTISALAFILPSQKIYSITPQKDLESEFNYTIRQDDNAHNLEIAKLALLQAEMLDAVKDQANIILFGLQQVSQTLIGNKVNFDESKISKKTVLEETKKIATIIEDFYESAAILAIPSQIQAIVMLNKVFMEYLIPSLETDITMFNAHRFELYLDENLNENSYWMKKFRQIEALEIFDQNAQNSLLLQYAIDNFGLTSFNKVFRYLQDEPMSLTGVPLLTTAYNTAFYSSLAVLTCAIATYMLDQKRTDDMIPNAIKPIVKPFQNFIGHNSYNVTASQAAGTKQTQDLITEARNNFGLFNHIQDAKNIFQQNPLVSPVAGFLLAQGTPMYNYLQERAAINYKKAINYLRGEVDKTANSMFESNTKKVYFKDMIGCEHLEQLAHELADFLKHPKRYQNSGIIPETGILLTGPSQTGKSFFAAALKTLIDEQSDNGQEIKFWYVEQSIIHKVGLDKIFAYARENAPFILFIDEIDMIGARRDVNGAVTNDMQTNMSGINSDNSKKVIVIGATNRPEELDFALLQDGRFGTQIKFEYPTYEHRKAHLTKTITKRNINALTLDDIDAIAQETDGSSFNTLDKIVTNALKRAMFESRPVHKEDFEVSLDYNFRRIRTNKALNQQEREVISIYHAGQAAARHILSTVKQFVKATIHAIDKKVIGKEGFSFDTKSDGARNQNANIVADEKIRGIKYGHVFTVTTCNNQELLSDLDQENELLALLAGQAALQLIKNKSFSNYGVEDRAKVLQELETKFAQGGKVTDEVRKQALVEKDRLTNLIKDILTPYTDFIHVITDALLQHNSIDKHQWAKLTANYPIG